MDIENEKGRLSFFIIYLKILKEFNAIPPNSF
jgi:hypothetical protein